jgi:hypothetical protein
MQLEGRKKKKKSIGGQFQVRNTLYQPTMNERQISCLGKGAREEKNKKQIKQRDAFAKFPRCDSGPERGYCRGRVCSVPFAITGQDRTDRLPWTIIKIWIRIT